MHFNPTFLLKLPDLHTFVLVRILETTVALLPIRSKLAFFYFYPDYNKKKSKWFWKKQKQHEVTLDDVLNQHSLDQGWVHAPCRLGYSPSPNELVLCTSHSDIHLVARHSYQKTQFINLFNFLRRQALCISHPHKVYTTQEYLERSKRRRRDKIENAASTLNLLLQRIEIAKERILLDTQRLSDLDQKASISLNLTEDHVHRLTEVNYSIVKTSLLFEQCKQRITTAEKRIERYGSCLHTTKDKYALVENRFKSGAWLTISCILLVVLILYSLCL